MIFKTKQCHIEIELVFIFIILTSMISNTLFKFLYYFFACYLFILFHELTHILVGSILNRKLIKIKFSISGVCASFEKERNVNSKVVYYKNILIYLSGPVSNLILAYIFKENIMIREINVFLAFLNLLPIFPLDGYNIILNLLKVMFKKMNYLRIMSSVGNIIFIILLIISIYSIKQYYNFSVIIFCIYVFVLKIMNKSQV